MVALPSKVHINWWKFNCLRLASWQVMKHQELGIEANPISHIKPILLSHAGKEIIKCTEHLSVNSGDCLSELRMVLGRKMIKFHSIAIFEEVGCL